MRRYQSDDCALQRPGTLSNQSPTASPTVNEEMPHCASNRYHSSQASAITCTKHHSNHFDTLSTLSRVMARAPAAGQAVASPLVQPQAAPAALPQPQVVIYVQQQHQHAQAIATPAPANGSNAVIRHHAQTRADLRTPRRVVPASVEASNLDVEDSEQNRDDQDRQSDSNAPSQQPSRSTRRPGSTVESWIGHLEEPASPTLSTDEQPPRALSSAGEWHDPDADESVLNNRPTPEIEAQLMTFRQVLRDPVIYGLAVLAIVMVTLFVLAMCAWFVWRYHINAVEFEYLEKMRKRKYGV